MSLAIFLRLAVLYFMCALECNLCRMLFMEGKKKGSESRTERLSISYCRIYESELSPCLPANFIPIRMFHNPVKSYHRNFSAISDGMKDKIRRRLRHSSSIEEKENYFSIRWWMLDKLEFTAAKSIFD